MVSGHMTLDVSHMAWVTHCLIVPTILKMMHPLFMSGKYAFPDWLLEVAGDCGNLQATKAITWRFSMQRHLVQLFFLPTSQQKIQIIFLVTGGWQEFADWSLTLCNWCSSNWFLNNCNQPPTTTCQECREHTFCPQNQLLPVGCWPISRPVWLGSYSLEPTLSTWLSHIQNTWPHNVIFVLVVTF